MFAYRIAEEKKMPGRLAVIAIAIGLVFALNDRRLRSPEHLEQTHTRLSVPGRCTQQDEYNPPDALQAGFMQRTFEEDFADAEARFDELQGEFIASEDRREEWPQIGRRLRQLRTDVEDVRSHHTKRWQIRAINNLIVDIEKLLRQIDAVQAAAGESNSKRQIVTDPPPITPLGPIERQVTSPDIQTSALRAGQLSTLASPVPTSQATTLFKLEYVREPGRTNHRLVRLPSDRAGLFSTALYWVPQQTDTIQPVFVPIQQ